MRPIYVKEEKTYTEIEIEKILTNAGTHLKFSDLMDVLVAKSYAKKDKDGLAIKYVGICIVRDCVIISIPKYYTSFDGLSEAYKADEASFIIEAIKRYRNDYILKKNQEKINDSGNDGILGIILTLLDDYFECGVYSNWETIRTKLGEGPIEWDKTIEHCNPLFVGSFPAYSDYYTTEIYENNDTYISEIHRWTLAEGMYMLKNWGLDTLFAYDEISGDYYQTNAPGSYKHMIMEIEKEQNTQFDTRKLMVLSSIKAFLEYLDRRNTIKGDDLDKDFIFFGTRNFDVIWQRACEVSFSDIKDTSFEQLHSQKIIDMAKPNKSKTESSFQKELSRPEWLMDKKKTQGEPLEMDCVGHRRCGGVDYIYIIDAKYYQIEVSKPGVNDIVKQYAYQMSMNKTLKVVKAHRVKVKNYFITPTDSNVIKKGYVHMDVFKDIPNLGNIFVRSVPAKDILRCYINNTHIDVKTLD